MRTFIGKIRPALLVMLVMLGWAMLAGGCARYARNVNTLYEPSADISGGKGAVYVIIPESQKSRSLDMKWVFGKVSNDDGRQIDELLCPRSPAEIIQSAFGQEFKEAGYKVILTARRPGAERRVIDLTKTEIDLDQTSDLMDLKAKCRVLVGLDVYRDGRLIKRLQYEASSSELDIKDRDLLAGNVLQDTLQSVMKKAMPELHGVFRQ